MKIVLTGPYWKRRGRLAATVERVFPPPTDAYQARLAVFVPLAFVPALAAAGWILSGNWASIFVLWAGPTAIATAILWMTPRLGHGRILRFDGRPRGRIEL